MHKYHAFLEVLAGLVVGLVCAMVGAIRERRKNSCLNSTLTGVAFFGATYLILSARLPSTEEAFGYAALLGLMSHRILDALEHLIPLLGRVAEAFIEKKAGVQDPRKDKAGN